MNNSDKKSVTLAKKGATPDISKLNWIRIHTSLHIPRYLIEQIKHKDFSVEDFFTYQDNNCIFQREDGSFKLNPLNQLWLLVDEFHMPKGVLWFIVDPLSKNICIQTFSIDKDYWGGGRAVKKLEEFVLEIAEKSDLKQIYWITNYPKHSEKYGFSASKNVLMEYNLKNRSSSPKKE